MGRLACQKCHCCVSECARTERDVSGDTLDSMSMPGGTRAHEKRPAEADAGQTTAQEAASYYSEMQKLNTRLYELKTMALGMHPSSCDEALQVTSTKMLLIMHEASLGQLLWKTCMHFAKV